MKCLECQRLMRPYLLKELSDKELSQFLDHVEHCQNCYEELELNMAVTSALDEKSELRDLSVYNFEEKLKKELGSSRRHLRLVHSNAFVRRILVILAQVVLVITIITAIELNMFRDQSRTHLYRIIHRGKETVEILTEADSDSENIAEDITEKITEEMTEDTTEPASETDSESVADGK